MAPAELRLVREDRGPESGGGGVRGGGGRGPRKPGGRGGGGGTNWSIGLVWSCIKSSIASCGQAFCKQFKKHRPVILNISYLYIRNITCILYLDFNKLAD